MSALTQVAAKVRVALDACSQARQALQEAEKSFEHAAERLGNTLDGVSDAETARAPLALSGAANIAAEACQALTDAERRARAFLASLGLDIADPASRLQRKRRPPTARRRPSRQRQSGSNSYADNSLPPLATGAGQKTHGRWLGPDGSEHSEVSGKDDRYTEAIQLFKEMKARRIPSRASDVEMKLAAHMRAKGLRSVTLVVNHTPCEGPMGCDALVPVILPKGYTLTVYGANGFVREYKGGETSPWLP